MTPALFKARTMVDTQFALMCMAVQHRRSGEQHRIDSWTDKILANILTDYVDARRALAEAELAVLAKTQHDHHHTNISPT